MEHKIIPSTWKSKEALLKLIKEYEADGWGVSALGEIFGGDILVLTKDDHRYEHEMVPVMFKTKEQLMGVVADVIGGGGQVCAIGECFGSNIMIIKKEVKQDA